MLFVNIKDYKIVKDYNYETRAEHIKLDNNQSINIIKKNFDNLFSQWIKKSAISVYYDLTIDTNNNIATEEEAEIFLSIVNVACASFFHYMTTETERKTDYRLDVPQKLQVLKTNRSLIKKACNYETVNDVFNFTLHYKDLFFTLCDEKDVEQEQTEFVHTVDELGDHDA